jgi:hypothetical protein
MIKDLETASGGKFTFPEGTVRLAPGPRTTRKEIHRALAAIERVVRA